MNKTLALQIAGLIRPVTEGQAFELVRVRVTGQPSHQTVQVMAEPASGRVMTVEDCAKLSHLISAVLDVADPIAGAWSLEVSSPGIDRPLTREKDWARYVGHAATVWLLKEDGQSHKKLRGKILRLMRGKEEAENPVTEAGSPLFSSKTEASESDLYVSFLTDKGEKTVFPLKSAETAQLILTDALIAEAMSAEDQAGQSQL